ncbi:MAG TPA: hypothetical protein VLM75_03425 [Spirochaetota bacterium]|nr:hypothetical protein [Spirochaetota bacterium]
MLITADQFFKEPDKACFEVKIMNLKYRIMIVLGLCFVLCISSYVLIARMFSNMENQLFEKCRVDARIGAHVVGETIALMVNVGVLSEKAVFEVSYVPLEGTNPRKYTTGHDDIFDRHIQPIIDAFLLDPDLSYAIPVDRNGYAPTHNSKFAKPLSADPTLALRNSRAKRIYDDPAGIKAARYDGDGTIQHLFVQDTGETMWDFAAPIRVGGKHWGAFRIGLPMERVDEINNQMIILVTMSLLVILSVTMLILFLVIPRKLYDTDMDIPRY